MRQPSEYGVYETETSIELARRGRADVTLHLAQCEDGLFRYAVSIEYSCGGMSCPISVHNVGYPNVGYPTCKLAEEDGLAEAVRCLPEPRPGDPASVKTELAALAAMLRQRYDQPSLF